jgi:hypothetical protein
MEIKEKKIGFKALYKTCPFAHWVALLSGVLILLHLAFRHNQPLMAKLYSAVVHPYHEAMSGWCDSLNFALSEVLIIAYVLAILAAALVRLYRLIRYGEKLKTLYSLVVGLLAAVLFVYAGFCLLWGTYYYADDFESSSGFETREISVDELNAVTVYFADMLNRYGDMVERDDNGFYCVDRDSIIQRSKELYSTTEQLHPHLAGIDINVKAIKNSRLLSYLDFTGFFFPFTGEACVNVDFPVSLFPSTVAHELAHQRGVAQEQNANFVAVLSSLESEDIDYCYSACLLAYTHLGNALYSADYQQWLTVYETLSDNVLRDVAVNRAYWQQFETPVQTVSNTVYEGLLQSYDQKLGMKSYGACVDMLVCYYLEAAES